ncbi:claudin-12 [Narcine bancroftii]|uniref:claudin-12 n=1 Tax=Narcine bancroftii TaxID=1343680 RepID=UPI003831B905
MSCREMHPATVLALLCGVCSLAVLLGATLLPCWRTQRLSSTNRNERNLTVSEGLWSRCVRAQGQAACSYRDADWYRAVDQLDLRLLQLALPLALAAGTTAALLCLLGMCHAACSSQAPRAGLANCLVNSAGCYLVAGVLFLLSSALALAPSAWLLTHTARLNQRYGPVWSPGLAAYLALGSASGLLLTSSLLFLWYGSCRELPSPLWQPLAPSPGRLPSYLPPSSYHSHLSTLEIDIPLVRQQAC